MAPEHDPERDPEHDPERDPEQHVQYDVRPACSDNDLRGILALQAANLPGALSPEERRSQGFVTLRHDFELLREMNSPWAHLIATPVPTSDPPEQAGPKRLGLDPGQAPGPSRPTEIAAYALVMLPTFRDRFPILHPMFNELASLSYQGRPLDEFSWYVMGQVCVAKPHRGRGLVTRLYDAHRAQMSPSFDLMITEVDEANPRSVRAHERAGFEILHSYSSEGKEWLIVALDLRPPA
jgi:ribosomal protein S18 acetylase RimI-like enzyme